MKTLFKPFKYSACADKIEQNEIKIILNSRIHNFRGNSERNGEKRPFLDPQFAGSKKARNQRDTFSILIQKINL